MQAPTVEGADYRNRIFDVAEELPFAGHPSLGAAVAVARARGDASARYVQQTGAGLQPVDVEVAADGATAARRCCRSRRSSGPSGTRRR